MSYRTSYLLLIFLFLFVSVNGQINITQYPDSDYEDCQYDVTPLNHPDYISWRDNNGGGTATSGCGGTITWTVTNESLNQFEGCHSGSIYVDWEITDDCGSSTEYAGASFDIQTDYPSFIGSIPDLVLDCGDPNNSAEITNWLNTYGGATLTDDCTPIADLIVTNSYNGTIPSCGGFEYINFEISDACETGLNYESGYIYNNYSEVSFTNNNFEESESNSTLQFCILVQNADLQAALDVEISFSPSSNDPATDGVDYGPLGPDEIYTIPAGPAGTYCFTIPLIDDNLVEADERVDMQITNLFSSLNEATISYQDEAKFRILDDDDTDSDGIENSIDNCPNDHNPLQEDVDNDGIGDPCDTQNSVTELQNIEDNIFIDKDFSGVITRSPDGQCWMIYVQNDGSLNTIKVDCP